MAFTKKHIQIMNAWAKVTGEGCEPIWMEYGKFREWSELRWAEGAVLTKVFEGLLWSPDNAFWLGGKDLDCWTPAWGRAYKKTPMPKENPCSNCRSLLQCTKICPARARWWDAEVAKWRRR